MILTHRLYCCDGDCMDHCPVCDDRIRMCMVCGGLTKSLPTDCPGQVMGPEHNIAVYDGELDFRGLDWVRGVSIFHSPLAQDTRYDDLELW